MDVRQTQAVENFNSAIGGLAMNGRLGTSEAPRRIRSAQSGQDKFHGAPMLKPSIQRARAKQVAQLLHFRIGGFATLAAGDRGAILPALPLRAILVWKQ